MSKQGNIEKIQLVPYQKQSQLNDCRCGNSKLIFDYEFDRYGDEYWYIRCVQCNLFWMSYNEDELFNCWQKEALKKGGSE